MGGFRLDPITTPIHPAEDAARSVQKPGIGSLSFRSLILANRRLLHNSLICTRQDPSLGSGETLHSAPRDFLKQRIDFLSDDLIGRKLAIAFSRGAPLPHRLICSSAHESSTVS